MQIVQNNVRPDKDFKIQNINGNSCEVVFYDNINEKQDSEGNIIYEYEMYQRVIDYRENLEETIEANIERWLNDVKEKDFYETATIVRARRDELLNETDWTQMSDTALSEEKQEQYKEYRQALRDVPEQEGFPYNVIWPSKEDL